MPKTKVDREAIAGLLGVATQSFTYDMLKEIDALYDRVSEGVKFLAALRG